MRKFPGIFLLVFFITTMAAGPALAQAEAGATGGSDASITGISRKFNPAISLNGLFYGMGTSAGEIEEEHQQDEEHHHHGFEPGIHLQEAELALSANVDAYVRADATLSYHGEGFEVENLYLTTLQMPWRLQARAGKFYVPFGLHNRLHTHAFPFVEQPLILEAVFGHHGWIDTGASLSWLAPLPWYLELTAGGFDGAEETPFHSDRKGDYAGFGRIESLFDLGDSGTFRLGGSVGWGPALLESDTATVESQHANSQVYGADLQLKIRPPQYLRTRGLVLQSEYLEQRYQRASGDFDEPRKGYYVMALGQVSQYWWLQARYDWMHQPRRFGYPAETAAPEGRTDQRMSCAVALVPTHFQSYKLQYSIIDHGGVMEYRTFFQINFTIGSHPAHEY
jgi:hypothetical protein